jgi:antitoxin (DNA-binding transcriptional repressor) of toxin-antitoxin stability system
MKRTLVRILFLACSLSTASVASAQESAAELRGRVLDAQDAVLPGVNVTITNQATKAAQVVATGADGAFSVSLAPGLYSVTASLKGCARHWKQRRSWRTSLVSSLCLLVMDRKRWHS